MNAQIHRTTQVTAGVIRPATTRMIRGLVIISIMNIGSLIQQRVRNVQGAQVLPTVPTALPVAQLDLDLTRGVQGDTNDLLTLTIRIVIACIDPMTRIRPFTPWRLIQGFDPPMDEITIRIATQVEPFRNREVGNDRSRVVGPMHATAILQIEKDYMNHIPLLIPDEIQCPSITLIRTVSLVMTTRGFMHHHSSIGTNVILKLRLLLLLILQHRLLHRSEKDNMPKRLHIIDIHNDIHLRRRDT